MLGVSGVALAGTVTAHARPTAKEVVQTFKRTGLDVQRHWKMRSSEYGLGRRRPPGTTGRRFIVRSLCEEWERPCDSGGRAFVFRRWSDLKEQKAYYDAFGDRYGDTFFSWTFTNRRLKILVQVNGELRPKKAHRYRRVVKRYRRYRRAATSSLGAPRRPDRRSGSTAAVGEAGLPRPAEHLNRLKNQSID